MDYFETFESKLYNPRNIDGVPNKDDFSKIRSAEQVLQDQPLFIGIAPIGSRIRGYSNESSDLDLVLVIDSSLSLKSGEKYQGRGISELGLTEEKGVQFLIADVNSLAGELNYHIQDPQDNKFDHRAVNVMAQITGVVTGNKIEDYREKIRVLINRLNSEQKQVLKERVLKRLVSMDMVGLGKIAERDPDFSLEDQKFEEVRKNLWEKRFDEIWNH